MRIRCDAIHDKKRMRVKIMKTWCIILCLWNLSNAQNTIPQDKDQLLKGEMSGVTAFAETHGYQTPQKIIKLKDQLGLTKAQLQKLEELQKSLPISTAVKGQEIIEAEEDLNNLFASVSLNEKLLRTKLERIGKLRSELRFTHLQILIKAKQVLSVNQWERLKELSASEVK